MLCRSVWCRSGCSDVVQVSLVSCRSFRCCSGQSGVVQVVLMSCRLFGCRADVVQVRRAVVQLVLMLWKLF